MSELKEEELSQVSGGYEPGDVEYLYCKYCPGMHNQTFKRYGSGWDGTGWRDCSIWECSECHLENYYDEQGHLI